MLDARVSWNCKCLNFPFFWTLLGLFRHVGLKVKLQSCPWKQQMTKQSPLKVHLLTLTQTSSLCSLQIQICFIPLSLTVGAFPTTCFYVLEMLQKNSKYHKKVLTLGWGRKASVSMSSCCTFFFYDGVMAPKYGNIWYPAAWIWVNVEFIYLSTVFCCYCLGILVETDITDSHIHCPWPQLMLLHYCLCCDGQLHRWTMAYFSFCFQYVTWKVAAGLDLKTCCHWSEMMACLCRKTTSRMLFERKL